MEGEIPPSPAAGATTALGLIEVVGQCFGDKGPNMESKGNLRDYGEGLQGDFGSRWSNPNGMGRPPPHTYPTYTLARVPVSGAGMEQICSC